MPTLWGGGIKRGWQGRKSSWGRSAGSPGFGIAGQIPIETIGNQPEAGFFISAMTPDLSTHINHVKTDGQQADTKEGQEGLRFPAVYLSVFGI